MTYLARYERNPQGCKSKPDPAKCRPYLPNPDPDRDPDPRISLQKPNKCQASKLNPTVNLTLDLNPNPKLINLSNFSHDLPLKLI